MTTSGAGPSLAAQVGIRDRRELPFFQVRVHATHAIREHSGGPRRLRAIGFYALLCQLANEQRHQGEHRTVRVTYDTLAARGQMSKPSVKQLLDTLERAQVVRYERLSDRATGAVVSLLHLLILDEPWIALTVAMADQLARPARADICSATSARSWCCSSSAPSSAPTRRARRRGHPRRHRRADRAGRRPRRRLQPGAGACGLLQIERRRAANGGRNLPSVYTVHEAPTSPDQGGETVLAGRRNGTGRAANGYRQGGVSVLAGPQRRYWQGGRTGTGIAEIPPPPVPSRRPLTRARVRP